MDSTNKTRWDDNLTGPAKNIAESNHSPIRVLAGPGTGKTFALMRRVARLLQQGIPPSTILVSTFTRTASRDLQKELKKLKVDGVDNVETGTLHSFAFKVLSDSDVLVSTGRSPRPLLDFEEKFLLQDLEDPDFGGKRERQKRLNAFNAAWARLQSDIPGWPTDLIDKQFEKRLLCWLKFHQAMLVGELIPECFRFLRNNPSFPIRSCFKHVLVDEYQDLNKAEQSLLDLLAENGNIIVIGDENQSIYSFKYAHPDGIAEFEKYHPNTLDENLEECRRCPRNLVVFANSLISNNTTKTSHVLKPINENKNGDIRIVQWRSLEDEAAGIAEYVKFVIKKGVFHPKNILVLAPRRQIGYAIRDALNCAEINAHSFFHEETLYGDPRLEPDNLAQQAFSLLCLLVNNEDRVSLRCWCGFNSSTLNRNGWLRITQHCNDNGLTPVEVLKKLSANEIKIPFTKKIIERHRILMNNMATLKELNGVNLVNQLFPNASWAEDVLEILSDIDDTATASDIKEKITASIIRPELPTDVDYVRIMSLHKSKGLNADLVIMAGCIQGLIPSVSGKIEAEQKYSLEEQRRLFYVAITRARRALILSSATQIPLKISGRMGVRSTRSVGANAITQMSQFISELGPTAPAPITGSSILKPPIPGHI